MHFSKSSFTFLVSATLSISLSGQASEEIAQAMSAQESAWNAGDIGGFMSHYWESENLKFVTKKGVTQGYEATMERYHRAYPTKELMGKLDFEILETQILSPTTAMVTGSWRLTGLKDEPGGYFTLIWQRIGDNWKIIYDHTS